MVVALHLRPKSGDDLLLYHCAALGRYDEERLPGRVRLEQALGGELTRLLLAALAPPQGRRDSFSP